MTYVSTDVDRILEYVKGRKKAELVEVSRALGMRAMDVDKWAKILEKQGLLLIQYDITKMYLVWKETQAKHEPVDKYIEDLEKKQFHKENEVQRIGENKIILPQPTVPVDKILGAPKPSKPSESKPVSAPANKPYYVETEPPKKKETGFLHGGAFNLFILGKNSDLKKPDATMQKEDLSLKTTQKAIIPAQAAAKATKAESAQASKLKQEPQPAPVKTEQMPVPDTQPKANSFTQSFSLPFFSKPSAQKQASDVGTQKANQTSQMLKSKVDAINATVAEIADLKAEKEKLYATEYVPLISRLDSQLSTLSDKASEKEGSLLNLRKRMAELPDKIARTESELQDSLKKMQAMEANYNKQLESLSQLRKLSQNYQNEINALRTEVERGYVNRYLSELKKLSQVQEKSASELSRKDEDIELRMKSARERLQQLLKESRALSKKFEEKV